MVANLVEVDLGCGGNKTEGSIGVDRSVIAGVDVVGLLNAIPLRDTIADVVYASHVLEHVPSMIDAVEEIWRICKPGAVVHVWSPHASCGFYTWSDPTHVRALTTATFDYWSPNSDLSCYSHARFEVVTRELHYGFRRDMISVKHMSAFTARLKRIIAKFVEPFANFNRIAQLFCERVWAPWLGFEEVYFQLKCIKEID